MLFVSTTCQYRTFANVLYVPLGTVPIPNT